MLEQMFDIFVIGGGINGCGIAADAAGRGLNVVLCEQGDLGGGTSSQSTKLIHGGLRYLEYYKFVLVRKALIEREVLLRSAPHIIRPMRFLLPHHKQLRAFWLIRFGLFIYDHLGGRKLLPGTTVVDLRQSEYSRMLKGRYRKALEYSDCVVDDTRLVVLNAISARNNGAHIYSRTKVISAKREADGWRIDTVDTLTAEEKTFHSKLLINAAGPWVSEVIKNKIVKNDISDNNKNSRCLKTLRLVKGSHIVVEKLVEHDKAYIFQGSDGRVIFSIPYQNEFTLIGTTDIDYEGDPGEAEISEKEINYLCESVGEYFDVNLTAQDVIWSFSGVRALYDDGTDDAQAVTRDYVLELDREESGKGPLLLNVIGGKITTYRVLAEEVLAEIKDFFPKIKKQWTVNQILPGGDISLDGQSEIEKIKVAYPFLKISHITRFVHSYGSCTWALLKDVKSLNDMGIKFGADLYEKEVLYLQKNEWAVTAEDILWRRSKLGLKFEQVEIEKLKSWIKGAEKY